MKFRITYKNSWNELKTITMDADTYYEALHQANSMFDSKNIVSVEEIDKPNTNDYNINMFDESHYSDVDDGY